MTTDRTVIAGRSKSMKRSRFPETIEIRHAHPNQELVAALSIWNIVERQSLKWSMGFRTVLAKTAELLSVRLGDS